MGAAAPLRIIRSSGITAVVYSLAAGAHVLGGGVLPPPWLLLGLGVLLLVPVTALSGRRFSFPVLAALTGLGQLVLHGAFVSLSFPGRCLSAGPVEHLHHHMVSCTGPTQAFPTTHTHLTADPSQAMMLAGHLAAVIATSLVLAKGDAALFHLRTWLSPLLALPHPAALQAHTVELQVWAGFTVPKPARLLNHYGLRGPPDARLPVPASV